MLFITTAERQQLVMAVEDGRRVRCPVCRVDIRLTQVSTSEPQWGVTCACVGKS